MILFRRLLAPVCFVLAAAVVSPTLAESGVETLGSARFTVITPQLIRMEYVPDGQFVDAASWFARNRQVRGTSYRAEQTDKTLTIDTGVIHLVYTHDGQRFSDKNLQATIKTTTGTIAWKAGMSQSGNLGGTNCALDRVRGPIPITPGLLSRDGWYLHDDSGTVLLKDDWYQERPGNTKLDWYLFGYGTDYKAALKSLTAISGDVPLPRKYAMGIWYSRNWAYKQDEWKQVVDEYRKNDFPLDVVVVDYQWHTKDWTGYTWNSELLPDPKALFDWFHQQGLAVSLNDHPDEGVQPKEVMYADFMRAMGQDPASNKTIPFDGGDKRFLDTFYRLTHDPIMALGMDFWWLDWKEPKTPSLPALDGLALMNDYNMKVTGRDGKRGQSFSRWAGWGDHRSPIHFSGDVQTGWKMIAFEVPFTSTAGNVGCFFWSHDIGGYRGVRNEESYTRWCQFGALSAALRSHSSGRRELDRRPWKYEQWAADSMRTAFHLRSRLMPYIYTSAAQAVKQSIPFIRPMYLNHPAEEAAYHNGQQYYFGDNLLVAPIAMPGHGANRVAWQHVWFPEGTWYQYFSGEQYAGASHVIAAADIHEFPLFVRGGVPLTEQPYSERPTTAALENLVLRCFPGADGQKGVSQLYEDDGISDDYKKGIAATTEVSYSRQGDEITIRIAPTQGYYKGQVTSRAYTVLLSNTQQGTLMAPGNGSLAYDAATGTNRIEIPKTSTQQEIVVRITAADLDPAKVRDKAIARRLDGLLGKPYAQWTAADRAAPGIGIASQAIRGVALMPVHQHPYLYGHDIQLKYFDPAARLPSSGVLSYKSWSRPITIQDGQSVDFAMARSAIPPGDTICVPDAENYLLLKLDGRDAPAGFDPSETSNNFGNLALAGKITTNKGRGEGVYDGVADGEPSRWDNEWSVPVGSTEAWARLNWPKPIKVARVLLYDRPNPNDQVLAGKLTFSDGSSIEIGALPNDGRTPADVTFPEKQITWVRFDITKSSSTTKSAGLAEFAAFDR